MRFVTLLIWALSFSAIATDKKREQRWIDQTIEAIFDGEPVFLNAAGHRFYSIYTEPETESVDGLIVLHGTGFHPNYEQVVQPLRVELAAQGWHTLSIQLPLLHSDADYEDYASVYPEVSPRMDAAVEYLLRQGATNIGIVAHSQGATMACYYLAQQDNTMAALVAIGMSAQHDDPDINSSKTLQKITIPVLDIYGSKDFAAVLQSADLRGQAGAHNEHYEQMVIDGAYHFFELRQDELLKVVGEWLDNHKADEL